MTKGFSKARVPSSGRRALAVATVVAAAAAGCGSTSSGTSASNNVSSAASSSASTPAAASTVAPLKPPTGSHSATGLRNKTVGLVIITQASEVFPQQQKAMKEAFAQLGWNIKIDDLAGDISKVPAPVENLLQSGVHAIVLQSVEPSFVGQQAAAMAKAKGVPIIGQAT